MVCGARLDILSDQLLHCEDLSRFALLVRRSLGVDTKLWSSTILSYCGAIFSPTICSPQLKLCSSNDDMRHPAILMKAVHSAPRAIRPLQCLHHRAEHPHIERHHGQHSKRFSDGHEQSGRALGTYNA